MEGLEREMQLILEDLDTRIIPVKELAHKNFRELSRSLMRAGSVKAVENYIISPEFVEEAEAYCRDMGWKEPEDE